MQEEFLNKIIETAPSGFALHKIILNEEGLPANYIFLDVNSEFERLSGLKRSEIINKQATNVFSENREDELNKVALYGKVALNGGEKYFEYYSDAQKKYYNVTVYSPEKYHFVTIFTNINKNSKTENEINKEKERYNVLFEKSPIAFAILHPEKGLFDVNNATMKLFACKSKEQMLSLTLDKFSPKYQFNNELTSNRLKNFLEDIMHKKHMTFDCILIDSKRKEFIAKVTINLIELDGDEVLQVAIQDVADEREAEAILCKSEEKYRSVFENTGTASIIIEENMIISSVNTKFEELSGYSAKEIEGKKYWTEFVLSDDIEMMKEQHKLRRKINKIVLNNYEFRFVNKNNEIKDIFLTIDIIPETKISIASLLDITERKQNEKKFKELNEKLILQNEEYLSVNEELTESIEYIKDINEELSKVIEKAEESEEKFKAIFNNNPNPIHLINSNFEIVLTNLKLLQIKNLKQEEIIGKKCYEIYHNRQDLCENCTVKHVFEKKESYKSENSIILYDGSVRYFETYAYPIFNQKNEISYVVETTRDITDKKKAEERLKHNLKFQELISNISSNFVGIYNKDDSINNLLKVIGEYSNASRSYLFLINNNEEIMSSEYEWCNKGVTPQINNRKNLPTNIFPWLMMRLRKGESIYIKDIEDLLEEAAAEKEIFESQDIKSVIILPLSINNNLIGFIGFNNVEKTEIWDNDSLHILQIVSQILANTFQRFQAEEIIKKSEEKYRNLIETTNTGYLIADKKGFVIDANIVYIGLSGHSTLEEIKGRNVLEWTAKQNIEKTKVAIRECVDKGFIRNLEVNYVDKKGKHTPIQINSTVLEKDGQLLTLCRDITERKKTEIALRDSEEKFKKMYENTILPIARITLDNKIIAVNNAYCNMLGYTEEELQQKTIKDITYPDSIAENLKKQKQLGKGEIDSFELEKKLIHKDGHTIIGILNASLIRDEYGKPLYILGNVLDITARKEAEEKLKESESYNRALFYDSNIPMVVMNSKTKKYIDCNNAAIKIYGFNSKEEVLGKTPYDVSAKIQYNGEPSEIEAIAKINKAMEKDSVIFEWKHQRANGEIWDAEVQLMSIKYKGEEFLQFSLLDITERRRARKQLRENEKRLKELNATKDKFFSIIAHDLITPIGSIVNFSDLLIDNLFNYSKEKRIEFTKIINDSSKNTFNLLQNLLEWSRTQTNRIKLRPEIFSVSELVDENIILLENNANAKNISIVSEINTNHKVFADKNMISTVIRNLVSNAIKFTDNGNVTIFSELKEDYLIISITDTGIGMEKEVINKLFKIEDTISTKGTSGEKGTGLGLVLCKEFVEKNKGKIWVESEEGKGSKFSFTLPI